MKAVPKSRTGSGNPKGVNKSWRQTPVTYFEIIPKSRTGHGNPDANATRSEESPKTGMGAIPKSMPAVPKKPRSWKSRGYSMTSPS